MSSEHRGKTRDEVLSEMKVRGVSVAAWARAHGCSPSLVYRVLAGHDPQRGESYRIAVELGLKPRVELGVKAFDDWLAIS